MRRFHFAAGLLLLAAFLASGVFMKRELLQGEMLDPLYRMTHRSRHIYILFAALIQLLVYLSWRNLHGWRRWVQWLSSTLVLISGVLFPVAFLVEPGLHRIAAPITFWGVVSALAGVVLLVAARWRAAGIEDS